MRAKEFITERKRKKRRPKYAAYGPGPYGWYGYDASYSGDSSGGDGGVGEGWSEKYKRSIDCDNPKGFSQRAHCQGRKKNESVEPDDVHKLADKKKVDWDNNPNFLALSKKITGVSHLDQMNQFQLKKMLAYLKSLQENGDEQGEVKFQKNLIPMPKGTVKVDVSDPLDWYNLGMSISDLDDADPREFGKGPPQTVITFGSEPEEHRYIKQLKRLGMPVHDIDEEETSENFADGKKPGRKGLAKRSGIPTKASVSRLRQIAKSSSGEKQRMAHWLANMKSGRNKK